MCSPSYKSKKTFMVKNFYNFSYENSILNIDMLSSSEARKKATRSGAIIIARGE